MEGSKFENVEKGEKEKPKMDFERILLDDIGAFGPYQLRTIALAGLIAIFVGWSIAEFLFTAARIDTRYVL